ncbi:G-protein coupled receptor 4 [Pseudorasbora parva]|uniref:G-protein coupled receptor 4 n=1 Tax=Pseudorasbora parva TaxID=51549 RepID=UPI00351DC03D
MAEQNASINGSTGGNKYNESTPEKTEMWEFFSKVDLAKSYVWIISVIEIPIMILTVLALCVLLKSHRSAPVFVIHLILSDLIQIISMLTLTFIQSHEMYNAHRYSLIVGLYFMAFVAVERYLLVSHPIWYESCHLLKVCCVISVLIWFVPLIFADLNSDWLLKPLPRSIASLIPYPIIVLCFIGTCRGLSHATSFTPLNHKLILGSLFLLLVTYTLLILPFVILNLIRDIFSTNFRFYLFKFLRYLKPLADCLLYLFLRPDVGDLLTCVQCCSRTTHSRDEPSRDSSGTMACSVSALKPTSQSQETASSSV